MAKAGKIPLVIHVLKKERKHEISFMVGTCGVTNMNLHWEKLT